MQRIKILVVEDSPLAMASIEHLMKKIGYKFDYVNNAEDALLLHYEDQYDLIFNDICLPKMNGLTMAEKIRQFERKYCLNRAKIVALTSYDIESIQAEILSIGINASLNKPISTLCMLNVIESCEESLLGA